LHTRFQDVNKGFEGLAHAWRGGREYLYALCESDLGRSAGGGRIDVFVRACDGHWKASHRIGLPKQAKFKDYAALAYRDRQLAVVSQASARLWVARVDEEAHALVPGSDAVYRFPNKSYGNVEGIAWCPATRWSQSPTGRSGSSPPAAPRRIKASIYLGSRRLLWGRPELCARR
jgi:hypothetical protein